MTKRYAYTEEHKPGLGSISVNDRRDGIALHAIEGKPDVPDQEKGQRNQENDESCALGDGGEHGLIVTRPIQVLFGLDLLCH